MRTMLGKLTMGVGFASLVLTAILTVVAGCGSSGEASGKKETAPEHAAATEYAATPRKALESWVTAVRSRDVKMICRLLRPLRGCASYHDELAGVETERKEMGGLRGRLQFGFVKFGEGEGHGTVGIGVVYGESPAAYAVLLGRGKTHWRIDPGWGVTGGSREIVLERPDPAAVLAGGRTDISFRGLAAASGSNEPNAALWLDGRHVVGRLTIGAEKRFTPIRWLGAPRLRPGHHLIVAGIRDVFGIAVSAWRLTVR
jgi:hypothetical protein